ncbi:hypothetical protein NL676_008387 [Syzygium grande]|nr:hypothetical protein NL676_008387 [Syzygium grande]
MKRASTLRTFWARTTRRASAKFTLGHIRNDGNVLPSMAMAGDHPWGWVGGVFVFSSEDRVARWKLPATVDYNVGYSHAGGIKAYGDWRWSS